MKRKKLLGFITVLIMFIAFQGFQLTPLNHSLHPLSPVLAQTTSTSSKKLIKAEKAVKKLEDKQTRKNLKKAQGKVDSISDVDKKASLQHRIDLVEQAIVIKEAQKAVKYLEDHQNRNNIADTKSKTDLVTDEGTKADLNNRINLVENALAAKETTQSSQAAASTESVEATQEDRIVYVTGGGKSDVYWYSLDKMPWNTNKNNIVQMKESEAIAAGKRHSLTE